MMHVSSVPIMTEECLIVSLSFLLKLPFSIIGSLFACCSPKTQLRYEYIPTSSSSAMGKSRSTACVMAYVMQKHHISPDEALSRLRQVRPMCEPNDGFMKQLELYHQMNCTQHIDDDPRYQQWLYQREVQKSIGSGKAPVNVRFEDEQRTAGDASEPIFELRCRKCRYVNGNPCRHGADLDAQTHLGNRTIPLTTSS